MLYLTGAMTMAIGEMVNIMMMVIIIETTKDMMVVKVENMTTMINIIEWFQILNMLGLSS
jgi:hypothetical protein